MINPATFDFLRDLKANNSKEWFDLNRSRYNALRGEFEHFINQVILEIGHFDKLSAQTTAKASIFRINRDIRFSSDKQPYKTNFGAFITRNGRKSINAGYYIHVEPGECFLAGGIYMPSAAILKAIRNEIYENTDEFKEIISARDFKKHFGGSLWGEKLRSAPKGFPKDFPDVEYLKYKHYLVVKDEADAIYTGSGFITEIKNVFRAMAGFNAYLNRAVEEVEG